MTRQLNEVLQELALAKKEAKLLELRLQNGRLKDEEINELNEKITKVNNLLEEKNSFYPNDYRFPV